MYKNNVLIYEHIYAISINRITFSPPTTKKYRNFVHYYFSLNSEVNNNNVKLFSCFVQIISIYHQFASIVHLHYFKVCHQLNSFVQRNYIVLGYTNDYRISIMYGYTNVNFEALKMLLIAFNIPERASITFCACESSGAELKF